MGTNYEKLYHKHAKDQKRQEEIRGWWRPQPGKHKVRMLPPPDGVEFFFFEYGVHYNIGRRSDEDDDWNTGGPVTCPRLTIKKRCPICEFVKSLYALGTESDRARASKIRAKKRCVSNVLILSSATPNEPKLWGYPELVMEQLNEAIFGESEGAEPGTAMPIDDPRSGHNIVVSITMRKTDDGSFPQYLTTVLPNATPLADPNCLAKRKDYEKLIKDRVLSYDEIRSILHAEHPDAAGGTAESGEVEEGVAATVVDDGEEIVDDTPPARVPIQTAPLAERRPAASLPPEPPPPAAQDDAPAPGGGSFIARARQMLKPQQKPQG